MVRYYRPKGKQTKKEIITVNDSAKRNILFNDLNELKSYYNDTKSSLIIKPTLTFRDSLYLLDSDLEIQVKFLGAGHTPGDVIVYVPKEKVLICGDLVHDFEPLFWNANPDSWIAILSKLKKYEFDYLIGGHGDIQKGKVILEAWQSFMIELKAITLTAIRNGLSLNNLQDKLTTASFNSLQKDNYAERIQRFRTSYMTNRFIGTLPMAIQDEIKYLWVFYYPMYSKSNHQ